MAKKKDLLKQAQPKGRPGQGELARKLLEKQLTAEEEEPDPKPIRLNVNVCTRTCTSASSANASRRTGPSATWCVSW